MYNLARKDVDSHTEYPSTVSAFLEIFMKGVKEGESGGNVMYSCMKMEKWGISKMAARRRKQKASLL
jgi:hypothetical protein